MSITRIRFFLLLGLAAFCVTSCTSDKQEKAKAWKSPLCHPTVDERGPWDKLAESEAGKNYVKSVEAMISEPEEKYDMDALYLDFRQCGRREPYFKPYFGRERRLCYFTFAECMENKGRFIKPLEKVIKEICSEKTWVLPCHDLNLDNFYSRKADIDLYSAQRAAELALCNALMGERLSPDVRELMRKEVEERVTGRFKNMMSGKATPAWWLSFPNNWNAVCLANVLAAGIYSTSSKEEQDFFIESGCKYIKSYFKSFPPDGYCTEGIGYWKYGFGHYILFSEIIRKASGGKTDPMLWPEAFKPAIFPFRAEIINGVYPSFADSPFGAKPSYRFMGFISEKFGLGFNEYEALIPVPSYDSKSYTLYPLEYMFCFSENEPCAADKKIKIDNGIRTWFEDAQILICRGNKGVKSDFGAVFKGGVNAGSHVHLDLGTYTVASGNEAVLIDPGSDVYTKKSFSKDRFTIKVLNSYGHPVPVINGKLQKAGKEIQATVLAADFTPDMDTFSLDIKKAYDDQTLKKLERTFRFDRKNSSVEIEDSFEFKSPGKFENALITFGKMEKLPDGRLKITDKGSSVVVEISSDCGPVSISEEIIDEELPIKPKLKPMRIALKLDASVSKGTVKLRILPSK